MTTYIDKRVNVNQKLVSGIDKLAGGFYVLHKANDREWFYTIDPMVTNKSMREKIAKVAIQDIERKWISNEERRKD